MYGKVINHKPPKGTIRYIIYTKEEADKECIEYKYWKEVEEGEFGISDDNIVCKCITRKRYRARQGQVEKDYIVFPIGSTFLNIKYSYSAKLTLKGRKFSTKLKDKSATLQTLSKPSYKNLAKAYALCSDIDLAILTVFGDLSNWKYRKIRREAKTEAFKKMVTKEMEDLLVEHGMGKDFTISLLKDTISLAKKSKSINNLLKAADMMLDLNGMKSKEKVKTSEKIEGFSSKQIIDSMNDNTKEIEEKKVSLERSTEKDS